MTHLVSFRRQRQYVVSAQRAVVAVLVRGTHSFRGGPGEKQSLTYSAPAPVLLLSRPGLEGQDVVTAFRTIVAFGVFWTDARCAVAGKEQPLTFPAPPPAITPMFPTHWLCLRG